MQELQDFEEEKREYEKWTVEFEKQKLEFEQKSKEIIEKEEMFNKLFSTQKRSIIDEVVGRPLRKCEEKYFTEKMKEKN